MLLHITAAGPILSGTISTAMARCGKPTCKCQLNPKYRHGPYYRWTGVIQGKSTTITLTPQEAKECSRRIANLRKLQKKIDNLVQHALAHAPWLYRSPS